MIAFEGYPFRKSSVIPKRGDPALKATHIYTFTTRKKTRYIVNVDEYKLDVYIVKFFVKSHSSSKSRYSLLTNERDARKIIYTCVEIGNSIYSNNNIASFGFVGSPISEEKRRENKLFNTKRFRVYKYFALFFFSPDNFEHTTNMNYSSYLLVNKKNIASNPSLKKDIISMFEDNYDMDSLMC